MKVKIKKNIRSVNNTEVHTLIDFLASKNYYGELTLYFQKGCIEHVKQTARISKKELLSSIKKRKSDKIIRKSDKIMTNIAKHNNIQLDLPFFTLLDKKT